MSFVLRYMPVHVGYLTYAWILLFEVLQHVKQQVRRHSDRQFQPATVVTDFEYLLMIAVETELPRSSINGCYFHFSQSIWRRITKLGLSSPYRRHTRLRKLLSKLMAIGFLPVAVVRLNFNNLKTSQQTRNVIRVFPQVTRLFEYMERTYISANSPFPIQYWNVFNRTMNTRTNNSLESE